MRKILFMSLVLFLLSINFSSVAQPSQFNLSDEKKTLRVYHDSGEYDREVASVVEQAKAYLDKRLVGTSPEQRAKMAIVYDIDETALSNYQDIVGNDFGGPLPYVIVRQKLSAIPIKPTLALYQYAQSKGIAQFFITGRREDLRPYTIKNLQKAGYSNWKDLHLEALGSHYKSAADFKAPRREELEKQGYDILFSIGDQCSDLSVAPGLPAPSKEINLPEECSAQKGDYEDQAFKLPNPFYFIP
jgi:predicted secreted acid phosphatase